MDQIIPQKKGRGRPKKLIPPAPDNHLPTIIETVEPPQKMMVIEDEPAANFTEIHNLNAGIDLSDIAKPAEIEPPPPMPEMPPFQPEPVPFEMGQSYSPIPSFDVGLTASVNPNESEEDRKERLQIVMKLKKYAKAYPAFAQQANINTDASLSHLKTQLDEIRALIQNKTTDILIKRTYLTSVSALEMVGSKTHVAKLDGLADLLARSTEVDEVLKEISCELNISYISPMKKLAFITLSSAYVLHTLNSKSQVFKEFGEEKVKPEVLDGFKDL